jgi:hypothetical protein
MLMTYPGLSISHPNLYMYISVFSAKWLIAFFVALAMITLVSVVLKYVYRVDHVFSQSIGAFPVVYLFVIFACYMYSLYYGVFIL